MHWTTEHRSFFVTVLFWFPSSKQPPNPSSVLPGTSQAFATMINVGTIHLKLVVELTCQCGVGFIAFKNLRVPELLSLKPSFHRCWGSQALCKMVKDVAIALPTQMEISAVPIWFLRAEGFLERYWCSVCIWIPVKQVIISVKECSNHRRNKLVSKNGVNTTPTPKSQQTSWERF